METINGLPENATWQEIEARIHLVAEVSKGREELDCGDGRIVHDKAALFKLARGES